MIRRTRTVLACCLVIGQGPVWANQISDNASTTCAVSSWFVKPDIRTPVLEEIFEKDGTVVERFSDGLQVQSHLGDRVETRNSDNFYSKSSVFTDNPKATDSFVRNVIIQAWAKHGKYSSSSQSRLRQYSEYYLTVGRPEQADRWANDYFAIQKSLPFEGMPLARAESILGEVDLKLGKSQEARDLLQRAANYYKGSYEQAYYCKVANNLGLAFLALNEPNEAINQFKISRSLAKKASPSLYKDVTTNLRRALSKQ